MNSPQSYFQLFGLPQTYVIDLGELTRIYRELQKATHPDKFAAASDRERRLSVQQAAQINDGFSTLKSPLKRAIYLLKLAGVELNANVTAMDPQFLMEQMELREALADVSASPQPLEAVAQFIERTERMKTTLGEKLAVEFGLENPNLDVVEELVREFQFIEKLHNEAEQLEADLEDQ